MRQATQPRGIPHLNALIASTICINLLGLALPVMMMQVYNRILPSRSEDTLLIISIGVIIAAACDLALKMARHQIIFNNAANFEIKTSNRILNRVLNADRSKSSTAPATQIAQDILSVGQLKNAYSGITQVTLFLDLPYTVLLLVVLTYITGWLVIVPASILLAFGTWILLSRKKIAVAEDLNTHHNNMRYDFLASTLFAIHTVKANCLEAAFTRRFETLQQRDAKSRYTTTYVSGKADMISNSIPQVMTISIVTIGATLVVEHSINVGALIAAVLLAGQTIQPFQRAISCLAQLHKHKLTRQRIQAHMRHPQIGGVAQAHLQCVPVEWQTIKLTNVSYEDRKAAHKSIFKNLNMEIKRNSTILISGTIENGKNELLELIAGTHTPTEGLITIGESTPSKITESSRRKLAAHLTAKSYIFSGSIMDNLTGFRAIDHSKIKSICSTLEIDRAVSALPHGYDTVISTTNNAQASHSLCQRIAIARELLHEPDIIIFNDADHGLDQSSQNLLYNLLKDLSGRKTIIMATENKRFSELATEIWKIEQGQIFIKDKSSQQLAAG